MALTTRLRKDPTYNLHNPRYNLHNPISNISPNKRNVSNETNFMTDINHSTMIVLKQTGSPQACRSYWSAHGLLRLNGPTEINFFTTRATRSGTLVKKGGNLFQLYVITLFIATQNCCHHATPGLRTDGWWSKVKQLYSAR